jgi:hypothetical protein
MIIGTIIIVGEMIIKDIWNKLKRLLGELPLDMRIMIFAFGGQIIGEILGMFMKKMLNIESN